MAKTDTVNALTATSKRNTRDPDRETKTRKPKKSRADPKKSTETQEQPSSKTS